MPVTQPAIRLKPEPLTRAAFAAFGDVIETRGASPLSINAGFAQRFHDLARIDVAGQGGRPLLSIFRARPRPAPIRLSLMERHPLASQAFFPLDHHDWFIVVAEGDDPCRPQSLRAFRAGGRQGVNYAPGVWHHPLLVVEPDHEFLVVDRGGDGANFDEVPFPVDRPVVLDL